MIGTVYDSPFIVEFPYDDNIFFPDIVYNEVHPVKQGEKIFEFHRSAVVEYDTEKQITFGHFHREVLKVDSVKIQLKIFHSRFIQVVKFYGIISAPVITNIVENQLFSKEVHANE